MASSRLSEPLIHGRGVHSTVVSAVEVEVAFSTLLTGRGVAGAAVVCVSRKVKWYSIVKEPRLGLGPDSVHAAKDKDGLGMPCKIAQRAKYLMSLTN